MKNFSGRLVRCISNQTLENYFPEPELYVRVHSFLKTLKVTVGPDVRSETEASAGQTSDTGNSFRLPEIVPVPARATLQVRL